MGQSSCHCDCYYIHPRAQISCCTCQLCFALEIPCFIWTLIGVRGRDQLGRAKLAELPMSNEMKWRGWKSKRSDEDGTEF